MATETLRPNGAGDETSLTPYPGTGEANWEDVDEAIPDDDSTYVKSTDVSWLRDLYNLPGHSGSGAVNSVTVYARCKRSTSADRTSLKIAIKTGGVAYESAEIDTTTTYTDYSHTWTTNPNTGSAWTWDEIDSLQVGTTLRRPHSFLTGVCRSTQVYAVADYTPSATEKTSSDIGSGAEGNPANSATLAAGDGGAGGDSLSLRLATAVDNGTGSETSNLFPDLFRELSAAETGQGSDLFTARIEMPTKGGGMKLWT